MPIDYCKPQPHRFEFVLAKCTGCGNREELLKAVAEHE